MINVKILSDPIIVLFCPWVSKCSLWNFNCWICQSCYIELSKLDVTHWPICPEKSWHSQLTFKMFRWLQSPISAVSSFLSLVGKPPQGNFKSYHMPLNYFVRQFSKVVPPSLGVFGWKAALGDVWTCLRRRWARSRALSGGAVSTMSSKWAEINLQNCTLFCISRAQKGHVDN